MNTLNTYIAYGLLIVLVLVLPAFTVMLYLYNKKLMKLCEPPRVDTTHLRQGFTDFASRILPIMVNTLRGTTTEDFSFVGQCTQYKADEKTLFFSVRNVYYAGSTLCVDVGINNKTMPVITYVVLFNFDNNKTVFSVVPGPLDEPVECPVDPVVLTELYVRLRGNYAYILEKVGLSVVTAALLSARTGFKYPHSVAGTRDATGTAGTAGTAVQAPHVV